MSYSENPLCEGCALRNDNLLSLLEAVTKAAKAQGLLRPDIESISGPDALQLLSDMESCIPRRSSSLKERGETIWEL